MEAVHERSLVSVKVEPRSTSRLSSALFILPLFYFKVDRLQIILVAKKYISTCRNCSSLKFMIKIYVR